MRAGRRAALPAVVGLIALIGAGTAAAAAEPAGPIVFAAASLSPALPAIAEAYAARGAPKPRLVFAASSRLARQIVAGAPADLLISAHRRWIAHARDHDALRADSIAPLIANRLVLATAETTLGPPANLEALPDWLRRRRLALADPAHVPAGLYAREALEALGVWDAVRGAVVPARSARQALRLVAQRAVLAGILYRSDALSAAPTVRVLSEIPDRLHRPIRYWVALTRQAAAERAAGFLAHLRAPVSAQAFRRYGFVPLNP